MCTGWFMWICHFAGRNFGRLKQTDWEQDGTVGRLTQNRLGTVPLMVVAFVTVLFAAGLRFTILFAAGLSPTPLVMIVTILFAAGLHFTILFAAGSQLV